jgi:hypothetical protein
MGGFANSLVTDNTRPWSGDHIVDPETVPGILFINQNLDRGFPAPSLVAEASSPADKRGNLPNIIDLAPTILNHLGVPVPQAMEGTSLL